MILTKIQEQSLIKGLQKIYKTASTLEEWGDMAYREEARAIKDAAKAQLKIFKKDSVSTHSR